MTKFHNKCNIPNTLDQLIYYIQLYHMMISCRNTSVFNKIPVSNLLGDSFFSTFHPIIIFSWEQLQFLRSVKGQQRGVHPFLVQIRDEKTYKPFPGVIVGEIGPKVGKCFVWLMNANIFNAHCTKKCWHYVKIFSHRPKAVKYISWAVNYFSHRPKTVKYISWDVNYLSHHIFCRCEW